MTKNGTVYVALSGGVDSAVALTLLLEQGYDAIPVFLKCFSDESAGWGFRGECPWQEDQQDAMAVCERLGVLDRFRSWNFEPEFFETVLAPFIEGKRQGFEPNPDVTCNQTIKFGAFFERARNEGAEFVATGHYARIRNHSEPPTLAVAEAVRIEPKRDQTYFLYRVSQDAFPRTIFPLGDFPSKAAVKEYADRIGLTTADGKPLSQKQSTRGLCFVGKGGYRDLLKHSLAVNPGPVMTRKGEVIGEHEGVHFYTIGQRKGIGINGGAGLPYYVVEKDQEANALVVGLASELWKRELVASHLHWIVGEPPELPLRVNAAIRHPQEDLASPCLVIQNHTEHKTDTHGNNPRESVFSSAPAPSAAEASIRVIFDEEQWAPCQGQSVVLYDERKEIVLGGGVIAS